MDINRKAARNESVPVFSSQFPIRGHYALRSGVMFLSFHPPFREAVVGLRGAVDDGMSC